MTTPRRIAGADALLVEGPVVVLRIEHRSGHGGGHVTVRLGVPAGAMLTREPSSVPPPVGAEPPAGEPASPTGFGTMASALQRAGLK